MDWNITSNETSKASNIYQSTFVNELMASLILFAASSIDHDDGVL